MKKQTIICFGDSITHCVAGSETGRWVTQLAYMLESYKPAQYEVYNRGIGGNTTSLAHDRFLEDVKPLLPATVLIEFGINDANVYLSRKNPRVGLVDYRNNLEDIVLRVRAGKGKPVLFVNHPLVQIKGQHPQGNGKTFQKNLDPYNQVVRKIASAQKVPLLDLPMLLKKTSDRMKTFYREDGVHLSPEGNRLYAEVVFAELKRQKIV